MPRMNYANETEAQDYAFPLGKSVVQVTDIDSSKQSKAGDERWWVQMTMHDGEFAGQTIYDGWTWQATGKGAGRMKLICKAFGFNADEENDYTPEAFAGRLVQIEAIEEEYEGKTRTKVAFAGYALVDGQPAPGKAAAPF